MRPNLVRAFIGGLLGTAVITLTMYFVSPLVTGGPTDIGAMLGEFLGASWIAGIIAHFVMGTVILPGIYVLLLYPWLKGSPPLRGMTWGLVLWLITQAAVMPLMGGGFFSSRAGGLETVMGSLIGHLVYGLVLGTLAGGWREAASHEAHEFEVEPQMRRAS